MFSLGGDDDIFGHMDRMMNQMMGGMMPGGGGGLPHGFPNPNQQLMAHQSMMGRHQDALSSLMMSPFGGFGGLGGPGGPGGLMNLHNSMMFGGGLGGGPGGLNNMMQVMQQQSSNAPGTFVQQQFVSYRSDGVNPPQVVERTHLNRVGPGGVREERRTLRDSRSGVQQMHIGRHINDRGHVMERSRNRQTGEEEESQEFINIEEEEAEQFQSEWSSRMGAASAAAANGRNHGAGAHRALQSSGSHRPPLAITSGGEGGGLSGASRSAAASPRHHHHHHQQHHHQQHHSRLSPPSPASTSSLDNSSSRGKKSLRVKPVAMKKEKKSKKPSTHLPKE